MPITTLFIDLDGTLYPNENGMWEAIANKMEAYMHDFLNLPKSIIPDLRQEYFRLYGTTLRGLLENYQIDTNEYLSYVHDIPINNYLKPDNQLRTLLGEIKIKKWIFTNSDMAHSNRVLNALDVEDLFEGIIDITALGFHNKPDPIVYSKALQLAGNPNPRECVLFEDSPQNLMPAKNLGMTTVLVGKRPKGPETDFNIPTIYQIKDMIDHIKRLY